MKNLWMVGILAFKDLRIEFRTRQAFLTTLFFALLVLVIFHFAFEPGSPVARAASPGILWVALLFPGIIQLNRSFQIETEEGTIYGILLSPVDRGVFFLGKWLANWTFLVIMDVAVLLTFVIFYNFSFDAKILWVALVIVIAGAGFTAVGTIFAAMVSTLRTREVLLPILLFPIAVPIILAAINGTQEVLLGTGHFFLKWMQMLAACTVVFGAAGFLVFDYVLGE